MSSEKKIWKKPEANAFANAEEAIAYYASQSLPEHVAAIKRLSGEAERETIDTEHELESAPELRRRTSVR